MEHNYLINGQPTNLQPTLNNAAVKTKLIWHKRNYTSFAIPS